MKTITKLSLILLLGSVLACKVIPEPIIPPVLEITEVKEVGLNSATLNSAISNSGNQDILGYGFVYVEGTGSPTIGDSKTSGQLFDRTTPTPIDFSTQLKDLKINTDYKVRAYATIESETVYGDEVSFKTLNIIQPGVQTLNAENISHISANLKGSITTKGTYPISEYGIVWGTSLNPENTLSTKVAFAKNVTVFPTPFSIDAKALSPSTTYYYRAYVIANNTVSYGEGKTFKTLDVVQPEIRTDDATNITINTAVLKGTVLKKGSYPVTEYGICWSTSKTPTTANSKASLSGDVTTFPKTYTVNAAGLNKNTSYYYRAYIVSNGVTSYGEEKTFKTADIVQPGIKTENVNELFANSARLSGSITSKGTFDISEYGICWNTSANPTTNNSKASNSGNPPSVPHTYILSATNLNPSTTYHFRAYVISNGVVSYGEDKTFKTPDIVQPGIKTENVNEVFTNSARLSGSITSKGTFDISEFGICWSTNANPTTNNSKASNYGNPPSVPYSYILSATNLNPSTTYHFRAYVISNGVVSYGEDKTFITNNVINADIRTDGVARISVNSALLSGTVTNKGTNGVTEYGLCWGTNANPAVNNQKVTYNGDVPNAPYSFNATATGLNPSTTYHYRAYAVTNGNVIYGSDQSFRTLDVVMPTVTTVGSSLSSGQIVNLLGQITSGGSYGISEYGFCYSSDTGNPTINNSKVSGFSNPSGYPFNYSFSLGDARFATLYYYRAYVISNGSVIYGAVKTFNLGKD